MLVTRELGNGTPLFTSSKSNIQKETTVIRSSFLGFILVAGTIAAFVHGRYQRGEGGRDAVTLRNPGPDSLSPPSALASMPAALPGLGSLLASGQGKENEKEAEKADAAEQKGEKAAKESAAKADKAGKKYPPPDPTKGHLEGRVVLKGKPPEIEPLTIPENHQDYEHCAERVKSEVLLLSEKQEIKNVVVGLPMKYRPPKRPKPREVVIDNKECLFVPHVQAVTLGSTIRLKNSDPFVHNTQSLLLPPLYNHAIPPNGEIKLRQKYRRAGWSVVKCSYHTWMQAHVYVFPHEYFDVSDAKGKYKIVNIPPGTHTIVVYHERLANYYAPVTKKVTIEAGKTTKLDIELEAPKE